MKTIDTPTIQVITELECNNQAYKVFAIYERSKEKQTVGIYMK